MKNQLNPKMKEFVEKVQNTMLDLYDEYVSIEDTGLQYECPLTRLIDDGQWIANMEANEVINEENA